MSNLGELAALGTAFCWAGTALFFEAAGRRVGSLAVNLLRLPIAFLLLAGLGLASGGAAVPLDASPEAWFWLGISGVIGFGFGDLCLFRAFVVIGPRLSSLMMSTAPVFTALFGGLFLGEHLGIWQWLGMSMVVVGIAFAVLEGTPGAPSRRVSAVGIFLALGGAIGQAAGLVVAKHGMADYDPFASTQIRVLAGMIAFSAIFTVLGRWARVRAAFAERRALAQLSAGAFCGPFLGVSLSLIAVQRTEAGIAAAIMSITPILLIPLVVILYRERVGIGGMLGAGIAVCGVAVLFMT